MDGEFSKECLNVGDFLSSPTGKIFKIIELRKQFAIVANCKKVHDYIWEIDEDLELQTFESNCHYSEMSRLEYGVIPSGELWKHRPTMRNVFDEKNISRFSDIIDWREFDNNPDCRRPKIRNINLLTQFMMKDMAKNPLRLFENKESQRDELFHTMRRIEKTLKLMSLT